MNVSIVNKTCKYKKREVYCGHERDCANQTLQRIKDEMSICVDMEKPYCLFP